jgi:pimeloyl-ACP methyl ester carboxylesterase
MAEHNARARDDGRITYAYDPQIARVFESEPIGDEDLWDCWGAIACPVLVIQGADSMLLTDDIVDEMAEIREFDLAVFEGCGHVPSLMAPEQIKIVRAWLSRESEDA